MDNDPTPNENSHQTYMKSLLKDKQKSVKQKSESNNMIVIIKYNQ